MSVIEEASRSPASARTAPGRPSSDQILGSLGIAVIALDKDLVVTYFSLAAQDLFGLSERQAVGRGLADIMVGSDELIELCKRTMERRLTIGLRAMNCRAAGRDLSLDCRASHGG